MKREKTLFALLVCIVLFAAALLSISFLERPDPTTQAQGSASQIVLNEILPGNRTYPAPDGSYPDFIEVKNISGSPVDLSGYMLSDKADTIGYTFPQGTVLPNGGCILCWCASDSKTYAGFGISRNGGETIYLYNSANVVIDRVEMPAVPANRSYGRQVDGSWTELTQVTPGFDNTPEGYAQWLRSVGGDSFQVVISEVSSAAKLMSVDAQSPVCDWVELYNPGRKTAVLDGAYLTDDPEDPLKWQIDSLSIAPGEYALIRCTGNAGELTASFSLPRSGCTVLLSSPFGNPICALEVPRLSDDRSWAMHSDGSYFVCDYATPGFENTQEGFQQWKQYAQIGDFPVVISEVMASNRSTLLSQAGTLCDWVELYNPGDTEAILSGAYLSDDPEERAKWPIPDMTLSPGQRAVIPCAGDAAASGEADFSLSASGGTVLLTLNSGCIIDTLTYPSMEPDRVYALQEDGSYLVTALPSPGYGNNLEGSSAYRLTQTPAGGLIISEVMSANSRYLIQADGACYDWIELYNRSDAPVNLSGYCISDDASRLSMLTLPDITLAPGAYTVIVCSGNLGLSGAYIQAPFTLNREECWVYLSNTGGQLVDYLRISDVPNGCSAGRSDGKAEPEYFAVPTPAAPNGTGSSLSSAAR